MSASATSHRAFAHRFPFPSPRVDGAPSSIRVLHVLPRVLTGGVERRRVTLARKLPDAFEQRVVSLTGRGPILEELRSVGVPTRVLGISTMKEPRAHLELHRIVRQWRPHIVHGAIFEGMIWGGLAALTHRVPVLLLEETSHPDDNAPAGMRRSARARAAIRFVARRSAGVVAVAPLIGKYLVEQQGIPEHLVHVILNGVAEFDVVDRGSALEERRRLGLPDDAFVVGAVCRMNDAHKRISDLIRAAQRLRDAHPRLRLLLVGDGGDLPKLRELARDLGLEDVVVFAGRREDRHLFFAMMDAFVLSSAVEAAPLGLMEAMLAGLPCVSTTVGGAPDIVAHEDTGLLVPRYRPDRIAESVSRIARDAEFRARLADNAKRYASRHLTGTRYAADVCDLYYRTLRSAGLSLPSIKARD